VFQQINTYTLSGKTLILSEAPSANADIDVRIISGPVGGQYNTRTFVGDNTTNTFVVSSGFTQDSILVFENGIAQVPTTDYTYDLGVLRFVSPPATNVVIHIRELSTAGPNLIAAIRGTDIVTGNLIPIADSAYTLGTSDKKYKKLHLAAANSLLIGNTTIGVTGSSLSVSSPIKLKSYSTVNLSNLTAASGDIIFNSDTLTVQYYNGSSWASIGASGSDEVDSFLLAGM
jgi:hypothetical protein